MSDHKSEEVNTDHETEGFIFVFEANGVLYSKLSQIDKTDGRAVTIHPVYYDGYNNNMNSEDIVWDADEKHFISGSDDGSWLETIKEYPDFIFHMDESEVVFYEDNYYHCDGCLLASLVGEVSTVKVILESQ